MFGDSTDQTNAAQTTDNTLNPALPPADTASTMGAPLAPEPSLPPIPSADPLTAPMTDDSAMASDPAATVDPISDTSLADDVSATVEPDATEPEAAAEETSPADSSADQPNDDNNTAGPSQTLSAAEVAAQNESDAANGISADSEPTTQDNTDTSDAELDSLIGTGDSDELIGIKRQALEDLTPLVHQLDQPADEQFRTLMRMIQASDNPSLIKQAFEAAQKITDDKERAQALLDVINEINYFTTQKSD